MNQYTDEEIIKIIEALLEGEGDEEQVQKWFENELSSLMPGLSDLIFFSEEELTAQEILDRARDINKPIFL